MEYSRSYLKISALVNFEMTSGLRVIGEWWIACSVMHLLAHQETTDKLQIE